MRKSKSAVRLEKNNTISKPLKYIAKLNINNKRRGKGNKMIVLNNNDNEKIV
jgi:hypothetical protein